MKNHVGLCLFFAACGVVQASGSSPEAVRLLRSVPVHFEPSGASAPGQFVARGFRYRFQFEQNRAILRSGPTQVQLEFAGANRAAKLRGVDLLRGTTNLLIGKDRSRWQTALPNFGRLQTDSLYPGIDLVYYGNADELEYDLCVKPGADPRNIRLRLSGDAHIDTAGNLVAGMIQKQPVAYQQVPSGARIPVASRYRRNRDGSFGFVLGRYDHSRELVIDPTIAFATYIGGSGSDVANGVGHDSQGLVYVAGSTSSTDLNVAGDDLGTTLTGTNNIFIAVLDPKASASSQLVYLTYYGGAGSDLVETMTVSSNGTVYIAGSTTSVDLPLSNPYQSSLNGSSDGFVLKFIPAQGAGGLFYGSYIGGSTDDSAYGIAVDAGGKIYITGSTDSTDFPTVGGFQTAAGGGGADAFVAVFDPSQTTTATLTYSSYLGGSQLDYGRGIAVAQDGTIWVSGATFSPDFPLGGYSYQGVYQPGGDAFISAVNPSNGGVLLYSSYFGGSGEDQAKAVMVDSAGHIVLAGYTTSSDFPVTSNALQPAYGGGTDAFISILNPLSPSGDRSTQVVYSTFYGGNRGEVAYDVKQDTVGNYYVTGFTMSPNLTVTPGALQPTYDKSLDAFLLKFNPAQAGPAGIRYATYVGSPGMQTAYSVDVNSSGLVYLAGYTSGPIFDAFSGPAKPADGGNTDAFVLGLNTCSFSLSAGSYQFPESGGSISVNVTTTPDCNWTASSTLSWVQVSPASGFGNGTVTVKVAANSTGAGRQDYITIAGIQFLIGQDQ